MAHSSSYKIGKRYVKDYICFKPLIFSTNKKKYIIIEKDKWFFDIKQIREYLHDLQKMGFNFKFRVYSDKIIVNVSNIKILFKKLFLFTSIRFLWEGKYNRRYDYDNFIEIINHYFKIKKLFNNITELECLLLAYNCYRKGKPSYNSNHAFTTSYFTLTNITIAKVIKNFNNISPNAGLNTSLGIKKLFKYDVKLKYSNKWTKENYLELFKEIDYEY